MPNIQELLQSIAQKEAASPFKQKVTLIAVGKKHSKESIEKAYQEGLRHFGENYLQEAILKITTLPSDVIWHFIGSIQSNKIKVIAKHFQWVHTLARLSEAKALSQEAASTHPLQVCIQVNISGEPQKNGVHPSKLKELADAVSGLPHLKLRGLMGVAEAHEPKKNRQQFKLLRELKDSLNLPLDTLSMGMSDDYPIAIEEGATFIRLGSAVFGPRIE